MAAMRSIVYRRGYLRHHLPAVGFTCTLSDLDGFGGGVPNARQAMLINSGLASGKRYGLCVHPFGVQRNPGYQLSSHRYAAWKQHRRKSILRGPIRGNSFFRRRKPRHVSGKRHFDSIRFDRAQKRKHGLSASPPKPTRPAPDRRRGVPLPPGLQIDHPNVIVRGACNKSAHAIWLHQDSGGSAPQFDSFDFFASAGFEYNQVWRTETRHQNPGTIRRELQHD